MCKRAWLVQCQSQHVAAKVVVVMGRGFLRFTCFPDGTHEHPCKWPSKTLAMVAAAMCNTSSLAKLTLIIHCRQEPTICRARLPLLLDSLEVIRSVRGSCLIPFGLQAPRSSEGWDMAPTHHKTTERFRMWGVGALGNVDERAGNGSAVWDSTPQKCQP